MSQGNGLQHDSEHPTGEDRVRSLLEAASDATPPTEAPAFFAVRVRAHAGARPRSSARAPLATAAARMLPVFVVVAALLVGAAGYESAVSATEREAAVVRALARDGGSDVLFGAMLLGSPSHERTGGSR